jgi:hypothetical protein
MCGDLGGSPRLIRQTRIAIQSRSLLLEFVRNQQ